MSLKTGERVNLDTMEIEKIPAVENKVEEKVEAKKEEEKPEDAVVEDEKVETEQEEEVKKEDAGEVKEEEKKPTEEQSIDVNDFIKEQYAEQYDIKNKEDLDGILDSVDKMMKLNESLESQLKDKKTEPEFKSEAQKKLWDFMQDVDPNKFGDRLQTYGRLVSIDTDTADPKILLEEKYIMAHPAWTREESQMKFDREYKRNYTANRDDFETDEEYKAELKSKELDMKDDVLKAKEFLKKQQEQFKTKPQAEEKSQESPVVKKMIEQNTSEIDNFEFTQIEFSPDDDKENDFAYKLSKDQIVAIKNGLKTWVSNPASYGQKCDLPGWNNVEENSIQVAFMLFGADMIQKNYEHAKQITSIQRAEEIATKKPDRKSKVTTDNPAANLSEEKQWEMAIAKKKAQNKDRQVVYR